VGYDLGIGAGGSQSVDEQGYDPFATAVIILNLNLRSVGLCIECPPNRNADDQKLLTGKAAAQMSILVECYQGI